MQNRRAKPTVKPRKVSSTQCWAICHMSVRVPSAHHCGAYPENQLHIAAVPAVAEMMGEEAPGMVVVLVWEQDANSISSFRICVVVVSPDETEEQWTGGSHDGDVRENPSAVVLGERVDCLEEEGVARDGAHGIIGDARGVCAADPGRVRQQRIKAAVASLAKESAMRFTRDRVFIHRPSRYRRHRSGGEQSI